MSIVGAFYKDKTGRILKTCRSDAENKIWFYYDDGLGLRTLDRDKALNEWEYQRGMVDFPNARDPILPYVFDLLYDIKYTSRLKHIIQNPDELDDYNDYSELLDLIKRYDIKL